MKALDTAEQILDRGDPENEPRPRAIFFDKARLVGERGVTATRLQLADEAEPALRSAIGQLNDDPKTESRMLTQLGRVRIDQDEPAEALRLALESLDVARRTGSEIGVGDIRDLRHDLSTWRDLNGIAELDDRLTVQL